MKMKKVRFFKQLILHYYFEKTKFSTIAKNRQWRTLSSYFSYFSGATIQELQSQFDELSASQEILMQTVSEEVSFEKNYICQATYSTVIGIYECKS